MWDALIVLSMGIVGGGAVVWLLSAALFARIWQRCTRLEIAVGDLQDRQASLKGKEMSERRWSKEKATDAELASFLHTQPAAHRKYDNDPLG